MKKIRNLTFLFILTCLLFLGVNVDAYDYFGEHKGLFYESELEDSIFAIMNYNNKLYSFHETGYKEVTIKDNKLEFKDIAQEDFLNLFQNESYISYDYDWETGIVNVDENKATESTLLKTIELENIDETENLNYDGKYQDKLYFDDYYYDNELEEEKINFYIYNLDGTLNKKITKEEIVEKLNLKDYEGKELSISLNYTYLTDNDLPYIRAYIMIFNESEYENTLNYILDLDLNVKFALDGKGSNIEHLNVFKGNNEEKMLYMECNPEQEYKDCLIKIMNKNNEIQTIFESKGFINYSISDGLITINGTDKEDETKKISEIYDTNLNLIKSFEGVDVYVQRAKETFASLYQGDLYNELTKGYYFIEIYTELENDNFKVENMILNIENSSKTNITGIIKDSNGVDLKDYIVELHSTPRTYTLESDGYFKFDNVEEGPHTLTIKKADGTVVATKEINVIISSETKLDGNTLYFNSNDNGIDLSLNINSNELQIANVEKGTKNKPTLLSNIIETITGNDTKVPETYDTLFVNIIMLMVVSVLSVIVIKKLKKLNS